jgi:hypothetical protein
MARIECPFCSQLGRVSSERMFQGPAALTTYYCDNCNTEWDEREDLDTPLNPRKRPSKTHRDKTS